VGSEVLPTPRVVSGGATLPMRAVVRLVDDVGYQH
jgi:hypothetical protein